MVSVKTSSYLVAFAITYFSLSLSASANPIATSARDDNPLLKRLDYAMHCTGTLYFTRSETAWMGLQPASVWNNDREEWCSDTSDDGGNCVCHDDGSLTCDPSGLGAQSAAPRECETPCTCQQLDPDTPDITETGTCSAESKKCNVASDCGSPSCACETFTTPSFGGEYGSFSTITKLCGLSSKIKERRALGEQVTCMCDDGNTASEACCGDLD